MTTNHTPTTEEVREFVESTYQAAICRGEVPADLKRTGLAAFDRWLATVKAGAWDEGADRVWNRDGFLPYSIRRHNPYRTKETP